MPINKELLELSIKECYSNFLDYLRLVNSFIKSSLSFWEGELEWDDIEKIEAKSNNYYCKHLLDLEWHCTKNTPSNTKLRFFLAVLLSIKDLERCCDYLYSISKIALQDEEKKLKDIVLNSELWKLILSYFQNIYFLFRDSEGKIHQEVFQKILVEKADLQEKIFSLSKQLNKELLYVWGSNVLQSVTTKPMSDLAQLELMEELLTTSKLLQHIIVKTDRFLDHAFNIVENFYYIKNQEIQLNCNNLSLLGERVIE
ncbi:phosphate transporter protein PhoU [Mycoplasma wenyonii str. Massachusetts]|uniref:Phosphate transporter protein PhoU n=1 Tax=Mycoplasma wenyonii (strain Massachusetts) TaxID=1197325 RepID=I6YLC7_MYCWM|nr:hypothetical protein [Mycoplasma wenyonii]AFN65094.1 phosphate transporter protein PhoU [Mycoplasma wenyonii str. Massachusetts]